MIGRMDKTMNIETIHESLVNGQRRQMVNQIDEYGVYDFWVNYRYWLIESGYHEGEDCDDAWEYFTDATISYFRIKGKEGKHGVWSF